MSLPHDHSAPARADAGSSAATPARGAVRHFGRLQLLGLLGKSERTMAWRVADPRSGRDLMIVLPRTQPTDAAALERWSIAQRQAGRVAHPDIAPVVETGVQDGWPYVAYDLHEQATLAERTTGRALPGPEAATLLTALLRALAYAHEAGVAHHDLQPFLVIVGDDGRPRLAGLGVAGEGTAQDTHGRATQRDAAERDVLCAGLLLHALLAGEGALGEPDIGVAAARLPPLGRDLVRLPWALPQPVADPLRAIVNRATDRQERQRYRSARTLLRALEGWLQADETQGGGPLALLADRLRVAGVLPASPGGAERAARLALMESERTIELAEIVLKDAALSFELLRAVNTAQARGLQSSGTPVLTVRRAIAMLGLEGVRRAALALRPWPGPLEPGPAEALQAEVARAHQVARVALALRPGAWDPEIVTLVAMLQSLGRLIVLYHFPDEAQQIRRLMQPAPAAVPGEPDEPGMSEEAASFAVLGADTEAIAAAVARQWGLGDTLQSVMRRLPVDAPVRHPDDDDQALRTLASCAHEAVDAQQQPAARVAQALQRVVQRYGRALDIGARELHEALQARPLSALPEVRMAPAPAAADTPVTPSGGGLRRVAAERAAR